MPIHEYDCHNCGTKFEMLIIGDRKPICPSCDERSNLEQLVSTFAMSFSATHGHRGSCANVYENFTVQHVRDKKTGKPIVVNSLKELRAAEKEHQFALAIASDDNASISGPPQNESWAGDVRHDYNWKFARDPKRHEDRGGVGVVKPGSRDKVLA